MARNRIPETGGDSRGAVLDELTAQLREHQQSIDRLRAGLDGMSVSLRPLTAALAATAAQARTQSATRRLVALEEQGSNTTGGADDVAREQLDVLRQILDQASGRTGKPDDKALAQGRGANALAGYADEVGALAAGTKDMISALIEVQLARADQAIDLQRERLRELRKDAKETNAETLRLEEERLDELQRQREKFVRQQQALSVIELAANAAVAIAKAAAQGGAAAPFTIAATLIALAAGLAKARAQAQAAIPKAERGGVVGQGGLIDVRRGGLLEGPRHFAGGVLIEAEGGERVIDRRTAQAYAPLLDWMQGRGVARPTAWPQALGAASRLLPKPDLPTEPLRADLAEIRRELQALRQSVEQQERLNVRIDEAGLAGVVSRWTFQRNRADRRAR